MTETGSTCPTCGAYKTRHAAHCPRRRPTKEKDHNDEARELLFHPEHLQTVLQAVAGGAMFSIVGDNPLGVPGPRYTARLTSSSGARWADAAGDTLRETMRQVAARWRAL